ncbi:MAG: tetratricopeptide repeat protein [Undibacterium sp.]|nr:tetratricopeptide repeat protein [Opitutaceae bacterium]
MKKIISLAFLLILIGCANPLNDATYGRYTDAGDSAMNRSDYIQAEAAYARAAQNVDWGHLGPAAKSGSLLNLANAKIRLKKYAEAEPLLLESLEIEKKISGEQAPITQKRNIALAMVYLELEEPERGLPYLRQTLPLAPSPDFIGLKAKLYPSYVEKLERLGRAGDAIPFRMQK